MGKVLLVGAYDILNCDGDVRNFIRICAENGATGIRIFASYAWGYNSSTLFKEIRKWDGGYPDKPVLPFYDLEQKNELCWDRFRLILECLKENEMGISIDFHCFPSISQNTPAAWAKYYYPWLSCIQRKDPDDPGAPAKIPDGFWSFHPRWRELQFNFVNDIYSLVSQYQVEDTYRVMNEYNIIGWEDYPADKRAIEWYEWFTAIMDSVGIPREKMIASNPRNPIEIMNRGLAKILSLHGYARFKPINTLGLHPTRLILSGDGGFDGTGDADAKGRKGLGVEDAKRLAEEMVRYEYVGYEYLSRKLYARKNDRAFLDDFNPQPLRVIAEIFGTIEPTPPEDKKQRIYNLLDEIRQLVKEL